MDFTTLAFLLFFNVCVHRLIGNACKGFKDSLKNNSGTLARNSHADLLAHTFLTALEYKIVWEGLQSCPLAVGQGTGIAPVIYMCAAAATSCYRVGRLIGVKAFVDLADSGTLYMEL